MDKTRRVLHGLKWNPFGTELPVEALYTNAPVENFCCRIEPIQPLWFRFEKMGAQRLRSPVNFALGVRCVAVRARKIARHATPRLLNCGDTNSQFLPPSSWSDLTTGPVEQYNRGFARTWSDDSNPIV